MSAETKIEMGVDGLGLNEGNAAVFRSLAEAAVRGTVVLDGTELHLADEPQRRDGKVRVYQEDCLSVCERLNKGRAEGQVAVLSFASGTSPGGMYRGDRGLRMKAQEESICARSGLWECLTAAGSRFYESNRALRGPEKALQGSLLVYSPAVPAVVANESVIAIAMISAPAVHAASFRMQRRLAGGGEEETERAIAQAMTARIRAVFKTAAIHGHRVLVLGAFGCGVFANSPDTVASCFSTVISELGHHFDELAFSIVDPRPDTLQPFENLAIEFESRE